MMKSTIKYSLVIALALSIIAMTAMRVEFNDLKLRRLNETEGQQLLRTVASIKTVSTPTKQERETAVSKPTGDTTSDESEAASEDTGARNRATDTSSLRVPPDFKVETVYSVCVLATRATQTQIAMGGKKALHVILDFLTKKLIQLKFG